ncbi:MAG TPA: site-2 protease family protein [Candidatus Limnocylindrales bacterium]|nr:site-2 protease family protein [Candidatus Limnocylindrales bacterium]
MSSLLDPYIPLLEYLGVWFVIVGIGLLVKADKHGIIVKPYYLMLRTSVFNSWMQKLGSRFRRGWLTFFDIGAAMGICLMGFIIFTLIFNALNLFNRSSQAGPVSLIIPLPGITISWEIFPYILISIAALLIPHEVAHGVASVLDKVPIKSSGVFLAVILPGGFVEIDEEDLSKRRARTKLRVFAAGSFTNVVGWFLVALLITNFTLAISPLYEPNSSGVVITQLVDGGAAQGAHVQQWSVLTYINGTHRVSSVIDLQTFLSPLKPRDNLTLTMINGQTFAITTMPAPENASRATVGVYPFNYYAPRLDFLPIRLPYDFANTLRWMNLILLGVAAVNMLPLVPFDGDRYLDTILTSLGLKNTKNVRTVASVVSLSLLSLNLILSFVFFGTIFPK